MAFLQYTSGSTAAPRGVMVTHANLLHNLARGDVWRDATTDTIGVSWLPVNHDMGLIDGVLQPVFSGFPAWLMSPAAFLQRPARWLQAISRVRATHSGGPNFAYDLCARRCPTPIDAALDLSSWRVAFNGSEPVRRSTLDAFQRAFGACGFRWDAFRPAYGLAESTLLVTSASSDGPVMLEVDRDALRQGRDVPAFTGCRPDVACRLGRPGRQVADGDRRSRLAHPLSSGPGRRDLDFGAQRRGGYWNRSEDTAATFHACIADTGDGPWLRTGDLGFIRDGGLFVTGRIKDVLIVRGLKHYPQDLELTVERASPAVRPGGCAAFALDCAGEEHLALVAEVDARSAPDFAGIAGASLMQRSIEDIRRQVADDHDVQLCSVALVAPGACPVRRAASSSDFSAAGRLRPEPSTSSGSGPRTERPHPRTSSVPHRDRGSTSHRRAGDENRDARGRLARVPHADADPSTPFALLGLDSLGTIELAAALEDALGIELPPDVVAGCRDARALAACVERLRADEPRSAIDPLEQMLADAVLPNDWHVSSNARRGPRLHSLRDAGTILLTGATGFLGAGWPLSC